MALKTAQEYIDSLRALKSDVWLFGEKVENFVDHPVIRPSINAIAMTYKVAHEPEWEDLATTTSTLTGEKINRFTALFMSQDDMVKKVKLQRMLGRRTGCCFQRCVGMDAINAVYSTTFEIDEKHGTEYHKRFKEWLKYIQQNDFCVQGAMTDVKGDRSLRPHQQEDPDMYVRVVERRDDGIVIRGAKAHQTGSVNSHEMLVMPTLTMREGDEDYAICCALPSDSEGVHFIYGRQSCDKRKLEEGDIDVGNFMFGGQEALTVLDDVFVPWERVFMDGEVEFSNPVVERFAGNHRQSYGGCKPGIGDVLLGATSSMTEYNGVARASHVRDKIAEMNHLVETLHACGLASCTQGSRTKAGNYQPDILMANVCKMNVTRFPYELCRLAEDLAGGALVTIPSESDLRSPEVGKYVEKYFKTSSTSAEERMRMLSLINSMTFGLTAPSYRTESMHGAGSPQAMKVMIERQSNMETKKAAARKLAGIDARENLSD